VNLLENAVASIEMGVEDYQSLDERRVLSSLRNLYAGTLLLLKEMLSRESPDDSEILLYPKIIPILLRVSIQVMSKAKIRSTVKNMIMMSKKERQKQKHRKR